MKDLSTKEHLFLSALEKAHQEGMVNEKHFHILRHFYFEYKKAAKGASLEEVLFIFCTLVDLIVKEAREPYSFPPYHKMITSPFDYHAFGIRFLLPLLDFTSSQVFGWENVEKIANYLKRKENVVLFANHQTETDPQVIEVLLKEKYPDLGKKMIFVAGERVLTDPAAIPFSLGRNLLCIYSKKYIDFPPDKKMQKQLHNQKTMRLMGTLLNEGRKIIYVAPSGGRDRKDAFGKVNIAPFDPQSIEMFYLIARQAEKKTHFFPLSLKSYDLLPPPEGIQKEIGESRYANYSPASLFFGKEISMEAFPGVELLEKKEKKRKRTEYIFALVQQGYSQLS